MNKYLFTLILCLFSILITNGQITHEHSEKCAHTVMIDAIDNNLPGYKDAINRTFQDVKQKGAIATRNVYTIKTVVHNLWRDSSEIVDDQTIMDQIAVLNEDFRYLNADKANLRTTFDEIAGDSEIEFELVSIERVQTTAGFEIDALAGTDNSDIIKNTANGGSSPWDVEQHLNIYVCPIVTVLFGQVLGEGQILGYATPPIDINQYPDLANWPQELLEVINPTYDGVNVHYTSFGGRDRVLDVGGVSYIAEGRTLVHEVGHYLGLRHYWGDGGNPLAGTPGTCAEDDGIEDTPAATSNSQVTGCDASKNTCDDGMDDKPDMWENYMDYSSEDCQVAFTNGQIDIMRAVLEGPRSTLIANSTSISDSKALANNINVLPNPTTGTITLDIDFDDNEEYQISVRDILGRQIKNVQTERGTQQLNMDLSNEANGVYFVEFVKGDIKAAKKVILAK